MATNAPLAPISSAGMEGVKKTVESPTMIAMATKKNGMGLGGLDGLCCFIKSPLSEISGKLVI